VGKGEMYATTTGERGLDTDPPRTVKGEGAKGVLPQNLSEACRDIDGPYIGDIHTHVQDSTEESKHGHRPPIREVHYGNYAL